MQSAIVRPSATAATVSQALRTFDPTLYRLIANEKAHQAQSISLIASENYTPRYCSDALSSCLSMKYSEGYPNDRYYAGNAIIDDIEKLCQHRALQAFHLDPAVWSVNVQALSGSPANFAVYHGLLKPRDRILYLDLPHGGHLSHGFGKGAVSATGRYFDCQAYKLNPETEMVDYDAIEAQAKQFKPKMIIAGYSAYPRLLDYKRFRRIADEVGAYLLSDIAHIAGMMSAEVIPSAFEYSDVVTTTTHKTLRGPRGALIFSRKPLSPAINKAVFPGLQGGPHNHTIAAIAAAMHACNQPEFRVYQTNLLSNAQALANGLVGDEHWDGPSRTGEKINRRSGFEREVMKSPGKHTEDAGAAQEPDDSLGWRFSAVRSPSGASSVQGPHGNKPLRLVTGGTDNHLVLADLKPIGLNGAEGEMTLESCNIISNKNTTMGDTQPKNPSGLRLGTPAMTTRGMTQKDFCYVGRLARRALLRASELKQPKMRINDFHSVIGSDAELGKVKQDVSQLVSHFPHIDSALW